MKKFKKIIAAVVCLLVGAGCCATLAGCGGNNAKIFTKSKDIYIFSAASAVGFFDAYGMSGAGVITSQEAIAGVEDSALIDQLDNYMKVVEGFIGGSKPITTTVLESDRVEYSNKISTTISYMSDTEKTVTIYYNETVPSEDNREADEDDEEATTHINGIVVSGSSQYQIIGDKEVEEDEIEVGLTIQIDESNKITIRQETEMGEQSFRYEVYKNGNFVEAVEFDIEKKDKKIEIEIEAKVGGVEKTFEFEKEIKNGQEKIKIKFEEGGTTRTIKVECVEEGSTTTYVYTIGEVEIDKDRD